MAAASLMVHARVGLLRTLPPADPRDVRRLHREAKALGIDWPAELEYPDFIRSLDLALPTHAAMVVACTRLLRSEEHTSELQSLMRISYAVFCLKKKKNKNKKEQHETTRNKK